MTGFQIRDMRLEDREEVVRLIYHSTNRYYLSIGRDPIFPGDEMSPSDIFDVYQRIDPGEGLVAVDDRTGKIIGSCFVHPRETHFSLGIMNSHHEHFGRGVARAMLARITERASRSGWSPVVLIWTRFPCTRALVLYRFARFKTCSWRCPRVAWSTQGVSKLNTIPPGERLTLVLHRQLDTCHLGCRTAG